MASIKELESKLTIPQRRAALMLVENEMETDSDNRRTQEEIAEELGITRMTLYKWRTQNRAFIDYKNALADDILSSMRPMVYRQLLKTITGPQPSIKGIDLFMRRFALLTDKTVQEVADGGSNEDKDVEKSIAELEKLINEE